MGTSSTLIRLIDVVFILLFGFISISEISHKSKIELPRSEETPPSNPDKETVFFVGISADGQYLVEDESVLISEPRALFRYLQEKVSNATQRGQSFRVRIRSNWDTPIKYTMAAADICDHLGIAKGIDVRKTSSVN